MQTSFGTVREEMPASISEDFLNKEKLRARLFGDTWRNLIPEVFRDVPAYYDEGNAIASLGRTSQWSRLFAAAACKHLTKGAKVLDVCTGTHDVPLKLLKIDPALEVHAVDGSRYMIEEGQRRARERNLTIHAQVCDANTLPFPDNTFDAVTLQFASRHLEIIKVFEEIKRVLKPGGVFCHDDMLRPASRIIEVPYLIYLRFSVWFTAKVFGSSPASKKCIRYFSTSIRNFYTPREMADLLKEIGFVNMESRNFLSGILSYHIAQKPE